MTFAFFLGVGLGVVRTVPLRSTPAMSSMMNSRSAAYRQRRPSEILVSRRREGSSLDRGSVEYGWNGIEGGVGARVFIFTRGGRR